jgi:hypothetical protein
MKVKNRLEMMIASWFGNLEGHRGDPKVFYTALAAELRLHNERTIKELAAIIDGSANSEWQIQFVRREGRPKKMDNVIDLFMGRHVAAEVQKLKAERHPRPVAQAQENVRIYFRKKYGIIRKLRSYRTAHIVWLKHLKSRE